MAGRLLLKLLALALLGLCASAWLVPASEAVRAAGAPPAPPLGGLNISGLSSSARLSEADGEIATARALHAQVVRVAVPWSVLEPSGPGQVEPHALAYLDRLVGDAAAGGIRVILTADSTPCWASSAPASLLRRCAPGGASKANAWPPLDPSAYASFVAYLAARYGTRLAAIEVWNEPDQANEDYLAGPEKPQRYAAILRAAYPAIKQVAPNVPVLAGSLVGSNGVFLRALYAAGIKGYYDGLAVHFYNLTLGSLRAIRETQLAAGDTKPLWLDEFGWTSCWPHRRIQQEQACVTPRVQATNITNLFRSLRRAPYVAAAVLYGLQDWRARRLRRAERARRPQACVRRAGPGARLALRRTQPGDPEPAPQPRSGGSQRLRSRRRLHAARSAPRLRAALQGAVHARPLQPLLDPAAAGVGHTRPDGAHLPVLAGQRPRRQAQHLSYSALCSNAPKVSARIFRSSVSDQWAM